MGIIPAPRTKKKRRSILGDRYWSPGKTGFLAIFFSHLNGNTPVQVALKTELSHTSSAQTEYPKIAKEKEKQLPLAPDFHFDFSLCSSPPRKIASKTRLVSANCIGAINSGQPPNPAPWQPHQDAW